MKKRGLGTTCIQGGYEPKKGEARVLPIYQSTTFKYDTSEQMGKLFDLEAEGYFYTHNLKKYASRLLAFAFISHFAYTFAFGIPFVPFKTSVFNQTGVMWALFWGLVGLHISRMDNLKDWEKTALILVICAVSFCADWSCVAAMAIVYIGSYRGDFKKQMISMMAFVCMYGAVYALFIDSAYGVVQLCAAAAIPLLGMYNGQKGEEKHKLLFYWYYPLHLALCGMVRLLLHGSVGIMIGG